MKIKIVAKMNVSLNTGLNKIMLKKDEVKEVDFSNKNLADEFIRLGLIGLAKNEPTVEVKVEEKTVVEDLKTTRRPRK